MPQGRCTESVNFTTPQLRLPRSLRAVPLASSDSGDLLNVAGKAIIERGFDVGDCTLRLA